MRKQSNSLNFILLKKVLIDHSTFLKYILNTIVEETGRTMRAVVLELGA